MTSIDHPIFQESIRLIQSKLVDTGLDHLEQEVLERLIHTSGDFGIQSLLKFSSGACEAGLSALKAGAPILTDTSMAAVAIKPMASKTLNSIVKSALDWVPENEPKCLTRTALGIKLAWEDLSNQFTNEQSPIVVIGSAPKALEALLAMINDGGLTPSLIIGMPVGFINVLESKSALANTKVNQIRIEGYRGGAAMAAASVNALLRAAIN